MNSVLLTGRLTKNPEVRYAGETAVAKFFIAVARPKQKDKEAQSDFPSVVCFGKTAELVEKYLSKGRMVGITGRLQTGSYSDKDGKKVYTTEVVADRVEFLDKPADDKPERKDAPREEQTHFDPQADFQRIADDDIPF